MTAQKILVIRGERIGQQSKKLPCVGTTRGSGYKTGSDQKWAESTQLRLALLKGTEFPEIFCFLDRLEVSEFASALCQSDENVVPIRQ